MDWVETTEGPGWEDNTKAFQMIRDMPSRPTARTAKISSSSAGNVRDLAKEGLLWLISFLEVKHLDHRGCESITETTSFRRARAWLSGFSALIDSNFTKG